MSSCVIGNRVWNSSQKTTSPYDSFRSADKTIRFVATRPDFVLTSLGSGPTIAARQVGALSSCLIKPSRTTALSRSSGAAGWVWFTKSKTPNLDALSLWK